MNCCHCLPRLLSSVALALGVGAGAALAADPPAPAAASTGPSTSTSRAATPPRQAFETLLAALPAHATADDAPRRQVVALRGETVDAAIRRTMGDLPFKEAFLRGVFLEINASAVQPGTMRLVTGAPLQVPTAADLRHHLERMLAPVSPAGPQSSPASGSAPAGDRRHWVRFP